MFPADSCVFLWVNIWTLVKLRIQSCLLVSHHFSHFVARMTDNGRITSRQNWKKIDRLRFYPSFCIVNIHVLYENLFYKVTKYHKFIIVFEMEMLLPKSIRPITCFSCPVPNGRRTVAVHRTVEHKIFGSKRWKRKIRGHLSHARFLVNWNLLLWSFVNWSILKEILQWQTTFLQSAVIFSPFPFEKRLTENRTDNFLVKSICTYRLARESLVRGTPVLGRPCQ